MANSYNFCGSCLYKSNLVSIYYDFMLIAIDLLLLELNLLLYVDSDHSFHSASSWFFATCSVNSNHLIHSFTVKCVVSRCTFCKLWRNFGFFCSVNHLSGSPLRKHMFTCMSSKGHGLWFLIGGFQSVLFVSHFKVNCVVIVLFWAIIDCLIKFASHFFLIFLILVTCKNKVMSASFLRQNIHSPLRFPSLF